MNHESQAGLGPHHRPTIRIDTIKRSRGGSTRSRSAANPKGSNTASFSSLAKRRSAGAPRGLGAIGPGTVKFGYSVRAPIRRYRRRGGFESPLPGPDPWSDPGAVSVGRHKGALGAAPPCFPWESPVAILLCESTATHLGGGRLLPQLHRAMKGDLDKKAILFIAIVASVALNGVAVAAPATHLGPRR